MGLLSRCRAAPATGTCLPDFNLFDADAILPSVAIMIIRDALPILMGAVLTITGTYGFNVAMPTRSSTLVRS